MGWISKLVNQLAEAGPGYRYGPRDNPAAEPTALAALALLACQRPRDAEPALIWLKETQLPDGQVPLRKDPPRPGWVTPLASLAWTVAQRMTMVPANAASSARETPNTTIDRRVFQEPLDRAAAWILRVEGSVSPCQPQFGHDSTLVGWPWVDGTHTWLEPTILSILALQARGWGSHARAIEGKRVVHNRMFATGGCNYGNTVVLGQTLLPHIQPSGMALLALADQRNNPSAKTQATVSYLQRVVGANTTPASLSWALMGLSAFGQTPRSANDWLEGTSQWATSNGTLSDHHAALLVLASCGADNPLVQAALEQIK